MNVKRTIDRIHEDWRKDRRKEARRLARKEMVQRLTTILKELYWLVKNPPEDGTYMPYGLKNAITQLQYICTAEDYSAVDTFVDAINDYYTHWPGGYAHKNLEVAIDLAWNLIRDLDFNYYAQLKLQHGEDINYL